MAVDTNDAERDVLMTATVQLTDTQLAQFTASGLIVVDGEQMCDGCCDHIDGGSGDRMRNGKCPCICHRVAPELWRKLTEECGFCREGCDVYECCVTWGRGQVTSWDYLCDRHRNHEGFHDCHPGCCEHCVGGRQVVTLTATCQRCDGEGVVDEDDIEQWHEPTMFCGEDDDNRCDCGSPLCPSCRNGVVTLGRFVVARLAPFVDTDDRQGVHDGFVIAPSGVFDLTKNSSQPGYQLALDPLPQPGQFVVQFEPVAALTGNSPPARPVNPATETL